MHTSFFKAIEPNGITKVIITNHYSLGLGNSSHRRISKKRSSFLQCYGIQTTGMARKWVIQAQILGSYVSAGRSIIHVFTKSFLGWCEPELLAKKSSPAVLGRPGLWLTSRFNCLSKWSGRCPSPRPSKYNLSETFLGVKIFVRNSEDNKTLPTAPPANSKERDKVILDLETTEPHHEGSLDLKT